ncbi:hypothetical protein CONLIGDRAFT_657546 [Coniochaeta ligniaria NRRL 30616]|uniref:Uncharacterized protein n=1 Tax=Coniochaeta ligniaria NRRL 30616 TaxID=1408157 RepID=A0A1J7J4A4_9PEZI|nr:hypothetical protein CONLIGDRAFT_657546 [Coniochaeta ligniaria NRRL 30616]
MATISQPRSIRAGGERATPRHPIPSMQAAFAESLDEATKGPVVQKPKLRCGDAKFRRGALLDQGKEDPAPAEAWRYRPGQNCHELRRLVAQIAFGVYLLLEGMANNKVDVISILQSHIDEVDEFLETTLEDMALATKDLQDRLELLSLPMGNMEVFEKMLEDRAFRLQIVTGNEAIEHIVSRTTTALLQTAQDVAEGLKSTREFTVYLAEQDQGRWRYERPDVESIYKAMKGNADGWYNAFLELQDKGNSLNVLIVRLNDIVAEMERRAGEVSRRTRFSIQPFTGPMHSPRSSQSSTSTITAGDSPHSKIPDAPPRLSLRLSSIITPRTSVSSYFDMSGKRDPSIISSKELPPEIAELQEPPEIETQGDKQHVEKQHAEKQHAEKQHAEKQHAEKPEEPRVEVLTTLEAKTYQRPEPVSRRSPAIRQEAAVRKSPMIPDDRSTRLEVESPRIAVTASPRLYAPANDNGEEGAELEEPVYILQPRTYTPQPPAPLPSPRVHDAPARPTRNVSTPKIEEQEWQPRGQENEVEEQEPETLPKQRTSLRQRVSLKTTPPESILVPPPRSRDRQPQGRSSPAQASPQIYQGPDSAYASDVDRQAVNSMVSMDPTLVDISPPSFQRPVLIPSPHSDQQFFRPVQASPHSPLQQRPHTSHTVTPRHPTYQQQHQRNVPSRMGMSMMSNNTTMTAQTGQTLKKKRSAFGWLKKAFSLDEEERAEFEAKKNQQIQNPYYDARSPKFLDGKRIR